MRSPLLPALARQNSLIARDSYNGLRLWKRRAESSALVAVGDRVYTVVEECLVALDADTGEIVRRYEGTNGSGQVRSSLTVLNPNAPMSNPPPAISGKVKEDLIP